MSYILEKTLVLSIISSKNIYITYIYENIFEGVESTEILKILGLIENK